MTQNIDLAPPKLTVEMRRRISFWLWYAPLRSLPPCRIPKVKPSDRLCELFGFMKVS